MPRIAWEKLVDFGAEALCAVGMTDGDAQYVAEIAAMTEAMGITTHGLSMLGFLDSQFSGKFDPKAQPRVVKDRGAGTCIDAGNCAGPLAMREATRIAMDKARKHGVGMVTVRNSMWVGALGVYLVPLAEEGLLAHVWVQASACKDCAPVGGMDARFSTNPVAMAMPVDGEPVIADFSTAAMSMGAVAKMTREGRKAQEPLFRDKDGNLTDDPSVVQQGGTILFKGGAHGGHCGYALSLWCEALSAVAGGSCNNPELPQSQNLAVLATDPEFFGGGGHYFAEMKRFKAHVLSSRTLPGVDEIRLPGQRAFRSLRDALEHGVMVDDRAVKLLNDLAGKHGLKSPAAVE